MRTLVIETSEEDKKGRSVSAELLAWINAPRLWDQADNGNNIRPVWMAYATTEAASRMFTYNLIGGKIAGDGKVSYSRRGGDKFQLLKTAGYQFHHKKQPTGGVVTTVFLPEFFWQDPGMVDPEKINFILLTTNNWRNSQRFDLEGAQAFIQKKALDITTSDRYHSWGSKPKRAIESSEIQSLMAESVAFLLYLDRRTKYPMPQNPLFGLQLFLRCLEESLVVRNQERVYEEHDFSNVGLPAGLAMTCTQEAFGIVLAEEVKKWHG